MGINSEVEMNGKKITMNVEGGVWSLNGKSEIVDKVSESFSLESGDGDADNESDEADEASPPKRAKIAEEKLEISPKIIDDSSTSSSTSKNPTELVNIHGKVFNVCPFSGKTLNDTKDDKGCPKMPIGQDFMGECPVLNTEQKITFDATPEGGGDGLKCPMTGKSFAAPSNEEIDKCPFMHKQVELIDYEENAKKEPKTNAKSLIEDVGECRLYCGFFCHKESLRAVFDKCEDLGVKLANKLIGAGALEVMKVAQDEIHSKC